MRRVSGQGACMSKNLAEGDKRKTEPDLGWSQVRETVLMLNLAVAQIERSMNAGDDSVTSLAESFTSVVGNTEVISKAAKSLPNNEEKKTIESNCQDVTSRVRAAIVAFQFYDILAQRLGHVAYSLGELAKLIDNPKTLYNPYEWHGLQEMIKSKYTLPADLAMFEAIVNGASVKEALEIAEQFQDKAKKTEGDNNIEMF